LADVTVGITYYDVIIVIVTDGQDELPTGQVVYNILRQLILNLIIVTDTGYGSPIFTKQTPLIWTKLNGVTETMVLARTEAYAIYVEETTTFKKD